MKYSILLLSMLSSALLGAANIVWSDPAADGSRTITVQLTDSDLQRLEEGQTGPEIPVEMQIATAPLKEKEAPCSSPYLFTIHGKEWGSSNPSDRDEWGRFYIDESMLPHCEARAANNPQEGYKYKEAYRYKGNNSLSAYSVHPVKLNFYCDGKLPDYILMKPSVDGTEMTPDSKYPPIKFIKTKLLDNDNSFTVRIPNANGWFVAPRIYTATVSGNADASQWEWRDGNGFPAETPDISSCPVIMLNIEGDTTMSGRSLPNGLPTLLNAVGNTQDATLTLTGSGADVWNPLSLSLGNSLKLTVEKGLTLKTATVSPNVLSEVCRIDGTLHLTLGNNTVIGASPVGSGCVRFESAYPDDAQKTSTVTLPAAWGTRDNPMKVVCGRNVTLTYSADGTAVSGGIDVWGSFEFPKGTAHFKQTGPDKETSTMTLHRGATLIGNGENDKNGKINNEDGVTDNNYRTDSGIGRIRVLSANEPDTPPAEIQLGRYGIGFAMQPDIEGEGELTLVTMNDEVQSGSSKWTKGLTAHLTGTVTNLSFERPLALTVRRMTDKRPSRGAIHLWGDNSFTGGLSLEEGTGVAVRHAHAAGLGDIRVGRNADLIVGYAALGANKGRYIPQPDPKLAMHVAKYHTLTPVGKIHGNIEFDSRAALNAADPEGFTPPGGTTASAADEAASWNWNISFAGQLIVKTTGQQRRDGVVLATGVTKAPTVSYIYDEEGNLLPGRSTVCLNGVLSVPPFEWKTDGVPEQAKNGLMAIAEKAGCKGVESLKAADAAVSAGREPAAALELFSGIAAAGDADRNGLAEITVAYDFGIDRLLPTEDGFLAAVKVQSRTTGAADYAKNTRVEILLNNEAVAAEEPTPEELRLLLGTDTVPVGVRCFRIGRPAAGVPIRFSVRAASAQ